MGVAALLALLAGCMGPAPMLQPPAGGAADGGVPAGLEEFYSQEVAWESCGGNYECADIEVPVDYDDPGGDTIGIAAKRFLSTGDDVIGSLVVNPGGPGGSGIEMVDAIGNYLSSTLLRSYDVVGFDPRGVGESAGVRCYDDAQLEEYYSTEYDLSSDSGWEDYVAGNEAYGEACLENTGPLMEHLDTVSAARDLDVLRAALGEPALTYLGFSYGTFLGATYAELFPDRVGRFVLDGAIDPSLDYQEVAAGQAVGFDRAFDAYLEDCLAGAGCPFTGTVEEARDRTVALLESLYANPAPVDADPDRPVRDGDLMNAMIIAMYNPQSWATLTEAVRAYLDDQDASAIRQLSDFALDRGDDGSYPADQGAFRLIDCLDYPVELDRDAIVAQAEALTSESEVFGPYFGYGEVGCATLPFQATAERGPIAATGAAPIVVIGTTRDPATPYEWAEALAEQLDSGIFLSRDGDGHTAYGFGSCIDELVDSYLVEGTLPQDGTSC